MAKRIFKWIGIVIIVANVYEGTDFGLFILHNIELWMLIGALYLLCKGDGLKDNHDHALAGFLLLLLILSHFNDITLQYQAQRDHTTVAQEREWQLENQDYNQ